MQTYRIATMSQDFDIIAFNGFIGEFVTTDDAIQADSTQRFKENPPEPELTPEQVEAIRQEHEAFLTQLEGLAVQAIASADWTPVLEHLNEIMAWQDGKLHEAQKRKANADELETPSVDLYPTTRNESKD